LPLLRIRDKELGFKLQLLDSSVTESE